jgi:hypothetical protein
VDDELDSFGLGNTDLKETGFPISTNVHGEITKVEDSDRIAVGVQHVLIVNPVLAGASQDHGIHGIKLT